jgi:DNA (cytosine-5)-methyltransferase 1
MTYGSLFSGVGGADLGLSRAGLAPLWTCEVDRQAQDVLRFHQPDVPNYADVREFPAGEVEMPDVVWMSPPCQDLSVAGKRAGLEGARSGLFFDATRIIRVFRDRGWAGRVLMEQVPGLLSSNRGEDFRLVLLSFLDLGASDVGWRILDSQWFGVAQRRRRLYFAVDFGAERAEQILALAQGLRGDPAPSRAAGQAAPAVPAGGTGTSRGERTEAEFLVPEVAHALAAQPQMRWCPTMDTYIPEVARTLLASGERIDGESETFIPEPVGFPSRGVNDKGECGLPLCRVDNPPAVAFDSKLGSHGGGIEEDGACPTIRVESQSAVALSCTELTVRRLTPRECERLQGWPDDHTRWGRKPDGSVYEMADGPRYRMCGNGVTATVSEWIARNLLEVAS